MESERRTWQFVLGLIGLAGACLVAAARAGPEITVPFAPTPPKLDGELADPAWQAATAVADCTVVQQSAGAAAKRTGVRVAFDGTTLYLAIECAEPAMKDLLATERPHDGGAWEDDCVEIFLRPGRAPTEYLQLVVNAAGSTEDYRFGDGNAKPQAWNPAWQAKTARLADRWQVEVAVPFASLGVPPPLRGDVWGFKVGREDRAQFDAAGARALALRTWPPGTQYGGATGYGDLVFENRNCLRNADFAQPGKQKFSDWQITAGDEDRFAAAAIDGVPALRFRVPGSRNAWMTQALTLQPNASYRVSAEVRAAAPGYLQVRPEPEPGREAPRLVAALRPSPQSATVQLDFPSGPKGRAVLTIGNAGGVADAEIVLRHLAVTRLRGGVLPDYMTWPRTEPDPVHGLRAAAARHGVKPYERLREFGVDGCERLVFRDTVTGTELWRLTNDTVTEGHDYALWPPYSANGAHLWFSSRRWIDGTTRATHCVLEARGDGIRLLAPWYNLSGWWHPRDGDTYFHLFQERDRYELTAVNVRSMKRTVQATFPPQMGMQIAEPGPWSDWLLVVFPDGLTGALVKMDGSARHDVKFPLELGETHFSRAHKDVFFSFHHPRTGKGGGQVALRITPDGHLDPDFLIRDTAQDATYRNMSRGGHGQSSPDETLFAHADGTVTLPDGSKSQIVIPGFLTDYPSYIGNNGYVSWRVSNEWMIFNNGPQVIKLWADGSNAQNLFFHNSLSTTYYSMPWAASSPDGTKVAYRSTMLGSVNFYQAVISRPLPPVNLGAVRGVAGVELTWQAPTLHREIAGYRVYAAETSGQGYRPLTPAPIAGFRFSDTTRRAGQARYYAVTAVEYSGLESAFSAEVCVGPDGGDTWPGAVRHFHEAEFATLEAPVVLRRDPVAAANLHYVSASDYLQAQAGKPGRAGFELGIPKAGRYRVLGRARVRQGATTATAALLLDGKPLGEWRLNGATWTWSVGCAGVDLAAGPHALLWCPADSAFELDSICLTDDSAFVPVGCGPEDRPPPPEVTGVRLGVDGVAVPPVTPWSIALSWTPVPAGAVSCYNVYAAPEPGCTSSPATRVGSVFKPAFVDWGLKPGTAYHYRVAAVDRRGNEGPPSAELRVETAACAAATVTLETESGQVAGEARLADDAAAAGGKAVWVPELGTTGTPTRYVPGKAQGSVMLMVSVPADGEYLVWARCKSIWREARLSLTLDAGRPTAWPITFGYHHEKAYGIWGRGATTSYLYCWCVARTNTCPDPRPFVFRLTKGAHRLVLDGMGEGLSVDQVVVTSDQSWVPDGVRNYY